MSGGSSVFRCEDCLTTARSTRRDTKSWQSSTRVFSSIPGHKIGKVTESPSIPTISQTSISTVVAKAPTCKQSGVESSANAANSSAADIACNLATSSKDKHKNEVTAANQNKTPPPKVNNQTSNETEWITHNCAIKLKQSRFVGHGTRVAISCAPVPDMATREKGIDWVTEKKLPAEGMVNGRKVHGRRRYQMIDDIKIHGSYAETKRKADNRKDWRMLSGFSLNEALQMIQDDQVAIPKCNNISITILSPKNACGNVTDEYSDDENNPTIDNMTGSRLRAETEVTLNTQGEGMDDYDDESHREWSPDLTALDFYLWEWLKGEVYKEKVNTRSDLTVRIMNNAALIKEHQADLTRAIRGVFKRSRKCIEVVGGIYENQL
ncbi:hypothetical protein ANN_15398 [Periplaneta americana]|uniref:Uncharacterized protein n=1 Tax=Periplaneta americana TaxID=6978 RepID=A0ABQ8SH47_PERAM|nr:hypothetical protein ANN_15398 [Periplaneta americana]